MCLSWLSYFYLPVPERVDVCGLPAASSLTCRVPVWTPIFVGTNTTLKVHFALAARLEPQVVPVMLKLPVVAAEIPVRDTFCLLVKVKVLAALCAPIFVLGKLALVGVKVAAAVPVPESDADCGLPTALSLTLSEPVREPSALGVKVRLILQFLPWASVAPQVVELTAKSPVVVMLLMVSVAAPGLERVTDLTGEVDPTTTLPKERMEGEREAPGAPPTVS